MGFAWMALASVLFAAMNVFVRLAARRVPWIEVASARGILGALVAVAVARSRGATLAIHDRRLAWARSIFGSAALLCTFYAMGAPAIALGDAVTLGSTSPIFVAILAPFLLGERGGKRVIVGTAVAFAGVAMVAGPSFHLAGHVAVVATLAGLFSGMAMIWLRRLGRSGAKESAEAIVVHFSTVSAVVTTLLTIPVFRAPDLGGALLMAATGASGGLAQLAMTRAYAHERAARLGPVSYLGVVLVHLLGAAVFGEPLRPIEGLGAALVMGSGIALAVLAMRDARAEEG